MDPESESDVESEPDLEPDPDPELKPEPEPEPEPESSSPTTIVVNAENKVDQVYPLTEKNLSRKAAWTDSTLRISIETHPVRSRRDSIVSEDLGASPLSSEATLFDVETPYLQEWQVRIGDILKNRLYSMFMVIITIWALFGDDIRSLTTTSDADPIFSYITLGLIFFFSLELVLSSMVKEGYFLGFYFWLDLIATGSLLFDVIWVVEVVFGSDSTEAGDQAQLARAGRTTRAGTRAGRIVRLVRLVQLVKLYKQFKEREESDKVCNDPEEMEQQSLEESKVGQRLSDLTTRRVIIGILTMLFLLPIFDEDFHMPYTAAYEGGLEILSDLYISSPNGYNLSNNWTAYIINEDENELSRGFKVALSTYCDNDRETELWVDPCEDEMILRLIIADVSIVDQDRVIQKLRSYEVDSAEVKRIAPSGRIKSSIIIMDKRERSDLSAILNIAQTVFIVLILGVGALLFSKDANDLVLMPIERMIRKVKDVSLNPLAPYTEDVSLEAEVPQHGAQMETKILEKCINKICRLLAVGFGEAGGEIIAANLTNSGDLNPMLPGRKIIAIFGFCDIRQFTDATEVLQEDVMEFVNSIGAIVHKEVHLHGGSANKNIGDAFLLVWKFPDECGIEQVEDAKSGKADRRIQEKIAVVADRALASFLVIMSALKRSPRLNEYRQREDLQERIPNFDIRMGFGLHVGWAIEGAIGSTYKIDASYLSPNVNMASRLEAATKQFGVPLLFSNDFAHLLSPSVFSECRQIDVVTVKGSSEPKGLYTFDVNLHQSLPPRSQPSLVEYVSHSKALSRYLNEFREHPDIVCVRDKKKDKDFREKFKQSFQLYIDGKWMEAKEMLTSTVESLDEEDGPTSNLLSVMRAHNYVAPPEWKGYRALTEK